MSNISTFVDPVHREVVIRYDLFDAESDSCRITANLSNDDGTTFLFDSSSVSGDVGYPVTPGAGKQIIWIYDPVVVDLTGTNGDKFAVRIVADDLQPIEMSEIVGGVSEERLLADMGLVEGVRHITANNQHYLDTRELIADRFVQAGLPVRRHSFNLGVNVIGRSAGFEDETTAYVVDAHYDTVATTPGADDNGSGVVGMLEVLRVLSRYPSKRTIEYIGFDREEAGLAGSAAYVQFGIPDYVEIAGVLNLEMIGFYSDQPNSQSVPASFQTVFPEYYIALANDSFRGNFAGSVANTASDFLRTRFAANASVHVPALRVLPLVVPPELETTSSMRRSDHASFWSAGIPAMMITDGADYRNPNYHRDTDTSATLNFAFMANIVRATAATLADLAGVSHGSQADAAIVQPATLAAPMISGPGNIATARNTTTGPRAFYVSDADTRTENLSVSAQSSDSRVIPDSSISIAGAGTNRTVTLTPAPNTTGTATITLTVSDGGRVASTSFVLSVTGSASASVSLSELARVYDGSPMPATVTTVPAGLAVSVLYDNQPEPPTNAGSYHVTATISDPDYTGSAEGTLTIAKAPASVSITDTMWTFDGTPKSVVVTTRPSGLATHVLYAGSTSPPSAPGMYPVTVSIDSINYVGSASATLLISEDASTGTYFGKFDGDTGDWAMVIRPDGTGVLIGHQGFPLTVWAVDLAIDANETVAASGEVFPASATRAAIIASPGRFSAPPGSGPALTQTVPFTLTGTIAGGGFSGSCTGISTMLTGTVEASPGPKEMLAGFYFAKELSTETGQALGVVGPSGRAAIVVTSGSSAAAGFGSLADSGSVVFTTRTEPGLTAAISPQEGTFSAELSPQGTSSTIQFRGLRESVIGFGNLVNLSTRALVKTGDAITIAGFVVAGTGSIRVLVRGVGPTLGTTPFNVPGVLPDPTLNLIDTDTSVPLAFSDNWDSASDAAAAVREAEAQTGAFLLPTGSRDAALVIDLPAGHYTALVSGVASGTGVALAEVYRVPQDATTTARLVNISTRGFVGAGDSLMIPGFVAEGNFPRRFLIRAVGPGLGQPGIGLAGFVQDPFLRVFRSGTSAPIAENDNWDDGTEGDATAQVAVLVGAFSLQRGSRDAALTITLEPNIPHTVHVSGVNGATGLAIAEVYEIP